MSNEHADENGGMPLFPTTRVAVVEVMTDRPSPEAEAHRPQNVAPRVERTEAWDRTVAELKMIRDETDTDAVWSEILRNLDAPSGRSD